MTDLCGVELRGPVLNGSGTFDAIAARRVFGDALLDEFPFDAFVSKTITLAPRAGNPPPRLWETPAGMINSIGLPNKGLEGFSKEDLPKLAELPVPLCVSVMGFSRDELAQLVTRVAERDEVALVELNFSCPNVETGLIMGADPSETARSVERLRPLTEKPLIVKLTPNATDPGAVAEAAEAAGADAVSLINTLVGMAIDVKRRRPILANLTGGLSGPAVKPVAVRMVYQVAAAVRVPVIGMGGIGGLDDALEFFFAGASAVQIGTAIFAQPRVLTTLIDDLDAWLDRQGVGSLGEIVGAAQPASWRRPRAPDRSATAELAVAAG